MDLIAKLELERVRERNRIAKRKSRAKQRGQQEATSNGGAQFTRHGAINDTQTEMVLEAPLLPGQGTYEELMSPFDSGGTGMFEYPELHNECHNWKDWSSPDSLPTSGHEMQNDSLPLTPVDKSLHLAPFEGPGFAPCSLAMDHITPAYAALASGYSSPTTTPLYNTQQDSLLPSSPRMLHLAIRNGSEAIAQSLLTAGACINSADDTGALPLHIAVQHGRHSVAGLLLTNGADPNRLDKAGMTPLELAVRRGDEDMVDLLLSKGAHVK